MMTERRSLIAVLLAALALRLWELWKAPFWYDEAFTGLLSRLSLPNLITATAGDTHPPLYYLIVWPLGQLDIRYEWAYRLPSALASVAAVYVLWLIVQRLGWPAPARWAVVILMAIGPAQMHYAQEARMYAVLQLLVLLAYLALISRRSVWFLGLGVLIMYTHNYGMFYYAALCLCALPRWWNYQQDDWTDFIKELFALAVPGLLFLPWLVIVLSVQMQQVAGGYWIQAPTLGSALYSLYMVFGSFGMPDRWQPVAMLVFLVLLMFGVWRWVQYKPTAWADVIILAFGPLVMALVISLAWKPVLLFRGLFPSAGFLYMLLVWRLFSVQNWRMTVYGSALLVPVVIAGLLGHYKWNPINKAEGDLKQQISYVRYIAPNDYYPADDTVRSAYMIHTNDSSYVGWQWYAPEQHNLRLQDPPCGRTLGGLSPMTRRAMGMVEIAPADLPRPAFIAWSLGPTASFCDEQQVYDVLKEAKKIMTIADSEYVEAGLWGLK